VRDVFDSPDGRRTATERAVTRASTGGVRWRGAAPRLAPKANRALPKIMGVPDKIGGPSRTRTLDPLIKSDHHELCTETQEDLSLEESEKEE